MRGPDIGAGIAGYDSDWERGRLTPGETQPRANLIDWGVNQAASLRSGALIAAQHFFERAELR